MRSRRVRAIGGLRQFLQRRSTFVEVMASSVRRAVQLLHHPELVCGVMSKRAAPIYVGRYLVHWFATNSNAVFRYASFRVGDSFVCELAWRVTVYRYVIDAATRNYAFEVSCFVVSVRCIARNSSPNWARSTRFLCWCGAVRHRWADGTVVLRAKSAPDGG